MRRRTLLIALSASSVILGLTASGFAAEKKYVPPECRPAKTLCDRTTTVYTKQRYGHGVFSGQLSNKSFCRRARWVTIYAAGNSNTNRYVAGPVKTSAQGGFSIEADYKDSEDRRQDIAATIPPGSGILPPPPPSEIVFAMAAKKTVKAKKRTVRCITVDDAGYVRGDVP